MNIFFLVNSQIFSDLLIRRNVIRIDESRLDWIPDDATEAVTAQRNACHEAYVVREPLIRGSKRSYITTYLGLIHE